MNERPRETAAAVKKVVPFAPSKDAPENELDKSGQAIVTLVQQAAHAAKDSCERAMDVAHKLSIQLRAAEDRARELENDVRHYQERADRADAMRDKHLIVVQHDNEIRGEVAGVLQTFKRHSTGDGTVVHNCHNFMILFENVARCRKPKRR